MSAYENHLIQMNNRARSGIIGQALNIDNIKRRLTRHPVSIKPGEVIKDRWEVLKPIGSGGFGEVFQAKDRKKNFDVAIKVEGKYNPKGVLKLEIMVIQNFERSIHCPKFYGSGCWGDAVYMVMQLLGSSLGQTRRSMPHKKFSLSTSIRLAAQMISAIQDIHDCGYIHRDVKLSNMALGLAKPTHNTVILYDFGLARRYIDQNGNLRPEREDIGFRGTVRYASLTAHDMQDLARRDDLWSLFYVCVEMILGKLPWRNLRDKHEVQKMKEEITLERLCETLPQEFHLYVTHIRNLQFEDRPNYEYLQTVMHMIMSRLNMAINDPYDWEA